MSKKEAKEKIKILLGKYERVKDSGHLKSYTEEETKKDFILPLFEILGWDIYDKNEVSAEESMSGGRVDYGFYLSGRIKFYVETKKLSADLNNEDFANQTIRYSWNKGATWAVLTDFENIKIFNAQDIEKKLSDKLFFDIPYAEYLKRFNQLYLLSKEAFQNDLLDREGEKYGKKLQKVPVSSILYKDLQKCRDILTKELGSWNPKIDSDLLDEGVQKILDRLIFIRVAEDREIEPPTLIPMYREWVTEFARGKKQYFYQWMIKKFRELNDIYNSNLFDKHPFEEWEEYSDTTKQVIDILYGKKGYYEYDFKAMPADVLGTVYENYLGYRLSQSKKGITVAKDAKKRKEHGIYYTPSFIVDYIVKNALGPVLEKCRTVEDIKRIKVLDPACGSGSFLIKAFNMISEKYKDFGAPDNELMKIQILEENIYGVDLDPQAVEITRLNLLINALDERIKMPFLDNIKNGNSLISGTDDELEKYFGKNFRDKKPFNWREEFSEVFKQGGFDVIIGNPPYIFTRGGGFGKNEKSYYYDKFKLQRYQLNTFSLFIEKGINLLRLGGYFGFIIPNNWLTINSFVQLRKYLLENTADLKIINAIDAVFSQAQVDTCILIFRKDFPTHIQLGELKDGSILTLNKFNIKDFLKGDFIINISKSKIQKDQILSRFEDCIPLGEIKNISTGLKAYQIGKGKPKQDEKIKEKRKFHSKEKLNKTYMKYLDGVDVKRYRLDWSGEYLSYGDWLAEPRKSVSFNSARILVRQIPSSFPHCINAVFTEEEYLNDINSMIIFNSTKEYDFRYILGIINSKLISYWFIKTFDKFQRKIFPQFKVNELARFPIHKANKQEQKPIVNLVDKILKLNKELEKTQEDSNKWNSIRSEVEKTDKKIDEEVYKLYGLTPKEIKIVEKSFNQNK